MLCSAEKRIEKYVHDNVTRMRAPLVGAISRARCEAMRDRDLINKMEIALRPRGGDLTVIALRFYPLCDWQVETVSL